MNQTIKRSIAGPIILISIGVLFLFHNLAGFDIIRIIWRYWPLILIALGVTKLLEYYRTNQEASPRQ